MRRWQLSFTINFWRYFLANLLICSVKLLVFYQQATSPERCSRVTAFSELRSGMYSFVLHECATLLEFGSTVIAAKEFCFLCSIWLFWLNISRYENLTWDFSFLYDFWQEKFFVQTHPLFNTWVISLPGSWKAFQKLDSQICIVETINFF